MAREYAVNHTARIDAPAGAVEADIEFLVPGPERPFAYGGEPDGREPPPSATFEPRRVRIEDIRGRAGPSLDANGAALLAAPTTVRNFYDDDELRGRYYPESAELIRAATGASRVVVFDHNVRRGARLELRPDRYDQGRPVHHAHADYTPASARRRLGNEFGAAAAALARHRWLQVNLWRPLRAPLRDAPLALCDGASLAPSSLRAAELRYPDRCGELYYLAHGAGQRWFYPSDMGVDEAWLFKNHDSAPPGHARIAPHAAFADPCPRPHVPPRESIEVRAFAFFDR
jgi:hypothetical protein